MPLRGFSILVNGRVVSVLPDCLCFRGWCGHSVWITKFKSSVRIEAPLEAQIWIVIFDDLLLSKRDGVVSRNVVKNLPVDGESSPFCK